MQLFHFTFEKKNATKSESQPLNVKTIMPYRVYTLVL